MECGTVLYLRACHSQQAACSSVFLRGSHINLLQGLLYERLDKFKLLGAAGGTKHYVPRPFNLLTASFLST